MRRVVALFLPTFPTDQIRRRNGGTPALNLPMVMAMQEGNRRVLTSVDDAARKLKLACGMTVAHAQTLVPNLIVESAKPDEDEAGLARLGLWCTRYSPLVTPCPPDTVFIDVAGSSHLFKGEAALLKDGTEMTMMRWGNAAAAAHGRTARHQYTEHVLPALAGLAEA